MPKCEHCVKNVVQRVQACGKKGVAARMRKVKEHMNNVMGLPATGKVLMQLGKDMHQRSEDLVNLKGERLPK